MGGEQRKANSHKFQNETKMQIIFRLMFLLLRWRGEGGFSGEDFELLYDAENVTAVDEDVDAVAVVAVGGDRLPRLH